MLWPGILHYYFKIIQAALILVVIIYCVTILPFKSLEYLSVDIDYLPFE